MFNLIPLVDKVILSLWLKFSPWLKITQGSTLSAVLLLTLTPIAQAAHINNNTALAATFTNPAAYCGSNTENQTSHLTNPSTQNPSIDCMLIKLRGYQQQDHHSARQQYLAYKAQAWLNYANNDNETSVNSLTPTGVQALLAGSAIFQALQNGNDKSLRLTPDVPSTSTLMRPDLWATLNALKASSGIDNAPKELAFSEVALVWAAANQCKNSERQLGSYFRMADRWLEQAREAYVNTHDSEANVALENLINNYYKQYALLDTGDDICGVKNYR
ncbi:hypothetical protein [Psychrobacter sp. CAL346-MNA-CIBAN-0220]|uniref:hypothetical protein n=1 Tax=Psychrobacter sp. CAL346-MNA-CIBAN-0220 TaxID=3140457 RepID=UPI003324195A